MLSSKIAKVVTSSLLATSLIVPVAASSVSADENKTSCSVTIYASKNQNDNYADGTGACKDEIYGFYVPSEKQYQANGMYTGVVKNGTKKDIPLVQSTKYQSATVTFYTVNDLEEKPKDSKPPKKSKPSKPKGSDYVSFKAMTNKKAVLWDGTTSKSKKVATLDKHSGVTITSEKANRFSLTYKKKKRWINKVDVDTIMRDFKVKTTVNKLNVRTGTSTDYKILNQLEKGHVMYASYSPKKDWLKVEYAPYKYGYVSAKYTTKIKEFKKFGALSTKTQSVRDTRSSEKGKSLGLLKKSSKVTVIGSKSGWYTISFKGKKGYIKAKYTQKVTTPKKK